MASRARVSHGAASLRTISLNEINPDYGDNKVKNTKYTAFTFLPKNLYLQFSRFMNFYFLVIAILQSISILSPVSPITIWLPLIFIFTISAVKEALDDISRRKADRKANDRVYTLLTKGGVLRPIRSEDIRVGDLVYLKEDEEVPCDLLILKCSDANGECYIQTANLDGESDFKLRNCVSKCKPMTLNQLSDLKAMVECEPPNALLYEFEGLLRANISDFPRRASLENDGIVVLEEDEEQSGSAPLTTLNLALQACVLRNTTWLVGAAIYTGEDTKFGQNKRPAPSKSTKLDALLDKMTVATFIIQFIFVVTLGASGYFLNAKDPATWYLDQATSPSPAYIIIYPLRFLLLLSLMIPISLKVTLDVVKLVNAKFIEWDRAMFDDESMTPAVALNTSISEGLGQVEFVFCDKTGTLTQNIMTVKSFSIDGHLYEVNENDLSFELKSGRAPDAAKDFLRTLALCHSVVPTIVSDKGSKEIVWKSPSPDEEALVQAAADTGVIFTRRQNSFLSIIFDGVEEEYELLQVLEFSSERRRMSVLVKSSAGQHFLFTKGADDMVFDRAVKSPKSAVFRSETEAFSRQGLRTLLIARKEIPSVEAADIMRKLAAANAQVNRRASLLRDLYEEIERNLEIVGIAAISDKLQDDVAVTISKLRAAGLKVWMLTGDKLLTAKQIAISCNLISQDEVDSVVTLEEPSSQDIAAYLEKLRYDRNGSPSTLVIPGTFLQKILKTAPREFLLLAEKVNTVLCCRVTPQQKSSVVRLVKDSGKVTLAIGDGGNDVAMIQEADIGVGIVGREGLQASRAADFSFKHFKYLQRLILVHGYYASRRVAFVGHFCLQKALYIAIIQMFFAYFARFSGSSFFNGLTLATYNTFFTALPIMFYALDQNIPKEYLLRYPNLYQDSSVTGFMSRSTILYWICRALYQAGVTFFLVTYVLGDAVDNYGSAFDQVELSYAVFLIAVSLQTFVVLFESGSLTVFNIAAALFTYVSFFVSTWVLNLSPALGYFRVVSYLNSVPLFWALVALVFVAANVPIVFERAWRFNYHPMRFQALLASRKRDLFSLTSSRDVGTYDTFVVPDDDSRVVHDVVDI